MLVVPGVVGGVLGARAQTTTLAASLLLGAGALAGYLCFNAASQWLKAAPAQRRRFQTPALTYLAAVTLLGLGSLVMIGPVLLYWLPGFAAAAAVGLYLVRRRRERSLLGGAITVAAASLLLPLVAAPDPYRLAAMASLTSVVLATAACFGYFLGTVLYVKTVIRERGSRTWWLMSAGYHAILAVVFGWLASRNLPLHLAALTAFFVLAAVRAAAVPAIALRRTVRARPVGLGEIVLSVVLLVLLLV